MNFLKQLFDFVRGLWTFTQTQERYQQQAEKSSAQLEALTLAFHDFVYETRLALNDEKHEREKLVLKLENELLKFERQLPPPKSPKNELPALPENSEE